MPLQPVIQGLVDVITDGEKAAKKLVDALNQMSGKSITNVDRLASSIFKMGRTLVPTGKLLHESALRFKQLAGATKEINKEFAESDILEGGSLSNGMQALIHNLSIIIPGITDWTMALKLLNKETRKTGFEDQIISLNTLKSAYINTGQSLITVSDKTDKLAQDNAALAATLTKVGV